MRRPGVSHFIWLGLGLQVGLVLAGRLVPGVFGLLVFLAPAAGLLLGAWYGATLPRSYAESLKGGFLVGFVGAFGAVLVAILLGSRPPFPMGLAAGLGGLVGAALGTALSGRTRSAPP
jgi:hypothetical protein